MQESSAYSKRERKNIVVFPCFPLIFSSFISVYTSDLVVVSLLFVILCLSHSSIYVSTSIL